MIETDLLRLICVLRGFYDLPVLGGTWVPAVTERDLFKLV